MRSLIGTVAFVLLPVCAASAPRSKIEPHFAPLASLLGHCWRAPFPDGQSDVQCFTSMYDGKLVHNSHVVLGSQPRYEGTTIYSWDPDEKRLRFHYFTSTGAVSEGYLLAREKGYVVPERHVGSDGKVTELQSDFATESEFAFSVVTQQKKDEAWVEVGVRRYLRSDAPEAPHESAVMDVGGGAWRLVWNSSRHGGWDLIRQELDGSERTLTPEGGSHWVWGARDERLLLLSKTRNADEPEGWRACAAHADGSDMQRLADATVADGFVDCHPSGDPCAAEMHSAGRKRIARLSKGRHDGFLDLGEGDAADPQYSPDGAKLLFRSSRSGSWELWLAQADGSDARQLTSDPRNDEVSPHEYGGEGPARFSPDGGRIVWMRKFPDGGYDVWAMDLDRGTLSNLTADHAGDDAYPSWSPDGEQIAFDSDRDGNGEIYLMDADGSRLRRITWNPGTDLAPLWVRLPQETWR